MRLYYQLGRIIYPFAAVAFFIHQKIFHQQRARVLVLNERDELLLVRNWSRRDQWGLPGGGVEKNEQPVAAARRELYEETGIDAPLEQFAYVTTLNYKYQAPIYRVVVSAASLPNTPHNPREITALQWFPTAKLPADSSLLIQRALEKVPKTD